MSKIIPVKEPKYYASRRHEQHAEVCPRLEKWMEKANSGGFVSKKNKKNLQASTKSRRYLGMFTSTKRKKIHGSLRSSPNHHRRLSSKRFRESGKRPAYSPRRSPRKPIRAKTIFNNIRQKSRNFGIRCKTSVSLWKQWIVNGIKWDKHNPLSFPKIKSKSSVNDIDNIKKSKRIKKELDEYNPNCVISETIDEEEIDEHYDGNHLEKLSEGSKVKKFLEMSYLQKATSLFRINKSNKESKNHTSKAAHTTNMKTIKSPVLEKLEESLHETHNENQGDINKSEHGNNGKEESKEKIKWKSDCKKDKHNEQEYEEVDDVSISDRDLGTKKFHPIQKLAEIDTEKIEKLDRNSECVIKQNEFDKYYKDHNDDADDANDADDADDDGDNNEDNNDDIYYDHHLNGYYRTEADPIGDEILRQKAKANKNNGAIHRAFNKLKLFF